MNVRREICPNCSRPLMKSRRMKFQMGQWRCAHCGAIWTGSLDLDEDLGEEPKETEALDDSVEKEQASDGDSTDDAATEAMTKEQTQSKENTLSNLAP